MTEPVLILTGPPGAGKTTTARQLAGDHERAVHLQSDLFFDFEEAGHEVAYAVLRAPLQVCQERVRARDSAVTDPAVVEQLWHSFADLGPFERRTIEVDGEAAQVVSQRLRDGTLALR